MKKYCNEYFAGGYIWEHFGANYALIAGGGFVVIGIIVLSTIMANGKKNMEV